MNLSDYQLTMMLELDDLDKIRLLALDHLVVEKKVEKTYNKRVWPKSFKLGDLVWKVILPLGHKDPHLVKWFSDCKGPYVISKVLPKKAYDLANRDREMHESSMNGKYLKTYQRYAWDAIQQ